MDNCEIVWCLVKRVLRWLGQMVLKAVEHVVFQWLVVNIREWAGIARRAVVEGLQWGLRQLETLKDEIIRRWRENLGGLAGSAAILSVKGVVKAPIIVIAGINYAVETVAKQTLKKAVSTAGKQAIKIGANPVGIIADITQAGLEMSGYKEIGKAVGATGNMASTAMLGFVAGGPLGAAVGAIVGLGFWGVGELVGLLF